MRGPCLARLQRARSDTGVRARLRHSSLSQLLKKHLACKPNTMKCTVASRIHASSFQIQGIRAPVFYIY
jgi:hypothetical protein